MEEEKNSEYDSIWDFLLDMSISKALAWVLGILIAAFAITMAGLIYFLKWWSRH